MADEQTTTGQEQATEAGTNAQTAETTQATGTQPGKQAGQAAQAQGAGERTFNQADVDKIVKERLEREKAKTEAAAQKARQEAEAQALAEQGKWKELAEAQGKRIADLEQAAIELKAAQAKVTQYEKALTEYRDAQFAGVPDHIKTLLEGRDILDQMAWLTANQEKVKPANAQTATQHDTNATRKGAASGQMTDEARREMAARLGVRAEYLPK